MSKITLKLVAQSLPLMLVIFVLFPRFGPLWSVPLPGQSAKTGISDSMSPGDVSKLSRSGELAFRATFSAEIPVQRDLYWRGLVLENFDGRKWTKSDFVGVGEPLAHHTVGGISYEVILEQSVHEWLLTLPPAEVRESNARQDGNYQWLLKSPQVGRLRYEATSYLGEPLRGKLSNYQRLKALKLPDDYNPQTLALGEQWQHLDTDKEKLAAVERFFTSNPFVYTLEPPLLGRNSIDEFLFGTRRGYCEHYAGAFVVLMRAAKVPARVVVGYQGGERNIEGGYLLVHQSDAHAWAEVWLEEKGWVRVDPTAWVAPSRIELGADEALAGEAGFLADDLVSLRRFRGFSMVAKMRMWMDNIEYHWVRWIVNFDSDRQWELLGRLFGRLDNHKLGLIALLGLGIPLALAGLLTIRLPKRRYTTPAVRAYLACCKPLAQLGYNRWVGETPKQFAARVSARFPEYQAWLNEVADSFYRADYCPAGRDEYQQAVAELRQLARNCPVRGGSLFIRRKSA